MKNVLLILAFLEGGLVMLLELLVPSVTMPIFGRSIILWSIVISLSESESRKSESIFSLATNFLTPKIITHEKISPSHSIQSCRG